MQLIQVTPEELKKIINEVLETKLNELLQLEQNKQKEFHSGAATFLNFFLSFINCTGIKLKTWIILSTINHFNIYLILRQNY